MIVCTLRGRGSVISLVTWRFIISKPASDTLETKLIQKLPAWGKQRGNVSRESQNSKTKSRIKKSFSLASTLLWVGGLVGLILTGSPIGGEGVLAISKAQAADFPVSAQLDFAKQAISNAAPIIQEGLPGAEALKGTPPPDGYLDKPLVVETTLRKDPPKPVVKRRVGAVATITRTITILGDHSFPYGYCTYYAASRRSVPWSGNAGTWLSGARSYGYATGSDPRAGAILVTYEGGRAGHVAYVEAVNGDQVTISEMNFRGWGIVSSRVISADSPVIKGYIY